MPGMAAIAGIAGISGIGGSAGNGVKAGIAGIAGIAGVSIITGADCGRFGAAARISPHPAKIPVNPINRVKCIGRIGAPPFLAL